MGFFARAVDCFSQRFISRRTAFCLLGVIGAGVLPSLLLRVFGGPNSLWLIANMWRGEGGGDSWDAIRLALTHLDTLGTQNFYEDLYYKSGHQFIYSPLSLVFFRLTQFPPMIDWYSLEAMNRVSWYVMLGIIVVMTFTVMDSSRRFKPIGSVTALRPDAGMVVLAIIAVSSYFSITGGFRNGQIQTWLTFLAMFSLLLLILQQHILCGVCIGLICIVKPQMALMLVWAALRRDWKMLSGGLVTAGLFGVVSVINYGWQIHFDYVSLVQFLSRRGESFVGNQSINGLLTRMFFLGPNVEFDSTHRQMVYNVWVHAATIASSAALAAGAILIRSNRGSLAGILDFCTALVSFTLASPVAYRHHFGLTVAVFWLVLLSLMYTGERRVGPYLLLGVSYALFANSFAILNYFAETPFNFLQSDQVFGAFMLLGLLYWQRLGPARAVFGPRRERMEMNEAARRDLASSTPGPL